MIKKMKIVLLAGIMLLLFSACGRLETTPEVLVTPSSVEIVPTAGLANRSGPETFSKYIGLRYPPLPAALSEVFSMMIQDTDDSGLWLVSDDQNRMLWLSKMTHHDSSGNAYWEVKHILELSDLENGVTLVPDGCSQNGEVDNEIIVVAKDEKVISAWRANTTLHVFEVIPINGIECHSDKGVSLE